MTETSILRSGIKPETSGKRATQRNCSPSLIMYSGIRLMRLRNTMENRGQHSPCFFGPEDGSSSFLRIVGERVSDYTAAHDPALAQ